jgi:biopolymer transport protein ExbD
MAFGTQDNSDEVMNEINMTPLVDVMLVLLIIFIITIPVMKHAVNIELPRASNQPQDAKPQTIRLTVDAEGKYFWNDAAVDDAKLQALLQEAAQKNHNRLCTSEGIAPYAMSVLRKPWRQRNAQA